LLGKNNVTQGEITAPACHPTAKVNKEEFLTYLSTRIDFVHVCDDSL